MRIRISMFDAMNVLFMIVLCLLVLLPFQYMVAISFSPATESIGGRFFLIPETFITDAYRYLFSTNRFMNSIGNTVYITVLGTAVNLLVSITLSYALSKRFLPGRRFMMLMIFFTMLFGVGMIPTYLLVKSLHLLDTYWALILPGATNAFTIMIMKTFFQALPESLDEAARIDGAGEMRILISVVLPLSMPVIATFALMFMVGHWNEFFAAILYLSRNEMWPIQVLLRQMIETVSIASEAELETELTTMIGDNVKMAAILISMIPIVAVYPFLQKYFAKGALLGSIKE